MPVRIGVCVCAYVNLCVYVCMCICVFVCAGQAVRVDVRWGRLCSLDALRHPLLLQQGRGPGHHRQRQGL